MASNEQRTALLVMDMQAGILANYASSAAVVQRLAGAIAGAREKGIPVVYVHVGFRQGLPELSADNKFFSASRERLAKANMDEWMAIDPALAPRPEEMVVTKRRVCAFTGSDLDVVLRVLEVRHLVLSGVSTSGVVLSTVREAADKDFILTVLSDGCTDGDEEVHRVLTTKVFPRQAAVLTIAEWLNSLP